jgi:hypothetical protein
MKCHHTHALLIQALKLGGQILKAGLLQVRVHQLEVALGKGLLMVRELEEAV